MLSLLMLGANMSNTVLGLVKNGKKKFKAKIFLCKKDLCA